MRQLIRHFLPGLGLLLTGLLHAQKDLYNTGSLTISPTGAVYVTGSFSNTTGGNFVNRGSLSVKNNISNAQVDMPPGEGTLYLSGTAPQSVNGLQPFSTFNLVTGNATGILLNNDLAVSGIHTFAAGIIRTDSLSHRLVYRAGASYTGYADTRHVNGWVRKAGNTDFTFPVGNGLVQRPLAIANISASSVFDARYSGLTPNTFSISPPLAVINLHEYWTLNRVSGGSTTIELYWDHSKVPVPPYVLADMRVAGLSGGSWLSFGGTATGNVTTTGSIRSTPLSSSFGAFTIGSVSAALPVTILQFTAQATTAGNQVSWTTTDEINVGFYDLQRSDDGISFYSIANITAINTSGIQQYQFTDSKPMQSTAWYRLRSVDKDGQFKFSKVILVSSTGNNPASMYAVNPAHGRIDLQVQRITGSLKYKINNLAGQTIQTGLLNIDLPGRYHIPLLSAVTHGVYILQMEKTGFVFTQRLLVD